MSLSQLEGGDPFTLFSTGEDTSEVMGPILGCNTAVTSILYCTLGTPVPRERQKLDITGKIPEKDHEADEVTGAPLL